MFCHKPYRHPNNFSGGVLGTTWARTNCTCSYNPYKIPYKWVTGVIYCIGVITPCIYNCLKTLLCSWFGYWCYPSTGPTIAIFEFPKIKTQMFLKSNTLFANSIFISLHVFWAIYNDCKGITPKWPKHSGWKFISPKDPLMYVLRIRDFPEPILFFSDGMFRPSILFDVGRCERILRVS